jgi:hypothetical protein
VVKVLKNNEYVIDFREIKAYDLFDDILKKNRKTNLYQDLRKSFAEKVIRSLNDSGLKTFGITDKVSGKLTNNINELDPIPSLYSDKPLGVDFFADCGIGYYSLTSVNYQHRPYENLPSLDTFYKRQNYSIGNFGFLVENGEYEFKIIQSESIRLVGYSSDIKPSKRKSFIALLGIHFDYESLKPIFDKYYKVSDKSDLIDVKISSVNYPPFFMGRKTGKFYICDCFKEYVDWRWDFKRFTNIYEQDIQDRVDNVEFLNGICHLCTKKTPTFETPTSGHSSFLRKYTPYYYLENKKRFGSIFHFDKSDNILVENELREYFGYPKIGEKWISETQLYKIVKEIFPDYNPIFHYRGKELEGLELDIFIPEIKLGIEYQGMQHYQALKHWGGAEGLEKRKENDKRKVELSRKFGYTLVEFSYRDSLNKDLVLERLEKNFA